MEIMRSLAGPQWKGFLLRGLLVLIFAVLIGQSARAVGKIEKQADGAYRITGADYQAQVSDGMLNSLKVGGAEFFLWPLMAGGDWRNLNPQNPELRLAIAKIETPQPDTVKFTLRTSGEKASDVLTATYRAAPDGLRVTLQRLSDGWGGSVAWRVGPQVAAVEPLARPGFGYTRLPGNGLVYALPVETKEAVRDMRYYFDNRRALDVTYLLNDAPYNRQSGGILTGEVWGRPLLDRRPLELIFAPVRESPVRAASAALVTDANSAPKMRIALGGKIERGTSFTLIADAPEAMFPVGKSTAFRLRFRADTPLNGLQTLTYRALNFNGGEAAQGMETITPQSLQKGEFRFIVPVKNTGWYRLIASLRPGGKSAPKFNGLPSEGDAEFGVYTPKPELIAPPTANSGVGITAAMGLRCIRIALYIPPYFPSREKSPVGNPKYDWKPLDDQINPFFAECQQYGATGFCLLNVRPDWAKPADFEALVRAIVERYKKVNHHWEIENEPQDRYTPENYVAQALKPAFRGAHAADPAALIMGPTIVRVDLRWFERFFNAKGGDFLDIVSTHSYIGHNRSWEEHGNAEDFRALQTLMQGHNAVKPIWQTEQGFTWNNHADMPRLHAAYVVRMFALAASVGVPNEHCYYFYGVYNGFEPWYLYDKSPNRSGMATRIYAEQTAGMRFQRELPMGKFAHALLYTDGKQDTLVCWLDDFSANARFRFAPNVRPQIADIMGVSVRPESEQAGVLTLKLDGFPRYLHFPRGTQIAALDRFPAGANLADAKTGAVAAASSFAGAATEAANLNDGTWHFDDGQSDQKIWVGKSDAPMPQWAAVRFAAPRRVDTIAAVTPSSHGGLAGARHYLLQAEINGKWKTLREARDNTTEWVLYAHFPPVTASAVRVVFLDLNNGWWREDKTKFSDMAPRVYELEAYGP